MTFPRDFKENFTSPIHGPILPAEIREGDAISARIVSLNSIQNFDKQLQVWKISPLGIELVCDRNTYLDKGTVVDLELKIGNQKSLLSGLVVDLTSEEMARKIIHIRLTPKSDARVESVERRTATRWICSNEFFPTAVASNPARFNDFIYFKIRDISSNGLKLHTSLRNKFIVAGMTFDCIVNFPMVSQIKMRLKIKSIRVELLHGKEVLSIGAGYDVADRMTAEAVSQYLMQFGSVSNLEELRKNGLDVQTVSDAIQFSYVRTKEEYEQVLALRFLAYKEAGKLKPGATPTDMADAYDARSRIIIGKYRNDVVSSARLTFNQFEDTMEQEKFVTWPSSLPRRDEMVEVMRACTRPDFRKSDLLMSMFKFIAITVAQSKRRWIVICATDEIKGLYEKIGFTDLKLSYLHAGLNDLKHNILLANVPDAMEGKTVDAITWNIVWADVSNYLEAYGLINPDPLTTIRIQLYRLLGPFARAGFFIRKRLKKQRFAIKQSAEVEAIPERTQKSA